MRRHDSQGREGQRTRDGGRDGGREDDADRAKISSGDRRGERDNESIESIAVGHAYQDHIRSRFCTAWTRTMLGHSKANKEAVSHPQQETSSNRIFTVQREGQRGAAEETATPE